MMVNDDRLVLVFDAGTQSTRGFLFNRKGDIEIGRASCRERV